MGRTQGEDRLRHRQEGVEVKRTNAAAPDEGGRPRGVIFDPGPELARQELSRVSPDSSARLTVPE